MKIAIVNDDRSTLIYLERLIKRHSDHRVVWVADNGDQAVSLAHQDKPDVILMDIVMPSMDGVETTRLIMQKAPCAILIVTASIQSNASKVFEAMGAGALDVIHTPVLSAQSDTSEVQAFFAKLNTISKLIGKEESPSLAAPPDPSLLPQDLPLVAIGSSTGGPGALAQILAAMPGDLGAAFVIVQHVDREFSDNLANWLNDQTALKVKIAQHGDVPLPGHVYLAGTDDHLIIRNNGSFAYTPDPKDNPYRPSVDAFFQSAAKYWSKQMLAVMLTGMGKDGAAGMLELHHRGIHTIAQSKETCAVYGMPKAAVECGAVKQVLPLNKIAGGILAEVDRLHKTQLKKGA